MAYVRPLILDLETSTVPDFEQYLEPVTAPSNYKDEKKIADYIAEHQVKQLERAALDLDLARIVAIGLLNHDADPWPPLDPGPSIDDVTVQIHKTLEDEAAGLSLLRDTIEGARLMTFNGWRFDLPLLERRYWYLRIGRLKLELDRYRSPHIDLYERTLSKHGACGAHALDWYARRLGWTDLPKTIESEEIGLAVKEDRWGDIELHVRVDVVRTARLARFVEIDRS